MALDILYGHKGVEASNEGRCSLDNFAGVKKLSPWEKVAFHAICMSDTGITKIVFPAHVDPKMKLPGGQTWLHLAAHYNNIYMLKYLIDLGLGVNALDAQRQTPLNRSLSKDAFEAAEILSYHGADIRYASRLQRRKLQVYWNLIFFERTEVKAVRWAIFGLAHFSPVMPLAILYDFYLLVALMFSPPGYDDRINSILPSKDQIAQEEMPEWFQGYFKYLHRHDGRKSVGEL